MQNPPLENQYEKIRLTKIILQSLWQRKNHHD